MTRLDKLKNQLTRLKPGSCQYRRVEQRIKRSISRSGDPAPVEAVVEEVVAPAPKKKVAKKKKNVSAED